jgi:ankyrin repeat protein
MVCHGSEFPSEFKDDWRTNMGFFSHFLDGDLHSAIRNGDMEEVKRLVADGAALNETRRQRTPLMIAARTSNAEIVSLLLEKGAELEAQDRQGNTPLMLAAGGWGYKGGDKEEKCLKVVKALLEKGANSSVCGKRGQTAMQYALGAGNRRVMQLLREHGACDYWRDSP